jgi:hypothetical protein
MDPLARAVPAFIASVGSSIIALFDFRTEAVRQGATAVAIEREYALYCAGAPPYDDADTGSNGRKLAIAVRKVIEGDVGIWRTKGEHHSEATPKEQ